MKENHIRDRILDVLLKNPQGLTFADIVRELGVHRQTATKYIYEMKGAGVIRIRDFKTLKLCYLNKGVSS